MTNISNPVLCQYTLDSTSEFFGYEGGQSSVRVTTAEYTCPWSAKSNVDWIRIDSGTKYSNTAELKYTVEENTAEARTGTLAMAYHTFTVHQEAETGFRCRYTLDTDNASFACIGGQGTLIVKTADKNCPWSAISNVDWITIDSGASG